MPPRIPTPPVEWENLVLAVCVHLGLPLLPIVVEWGHTGMVTPSSITLTTAMFTITIGASSRSRAFFGLALVGSLFYAVQYGIVAEGARSGAKPLMEEFWPVTLARWVIAGILVIHLAERYHRHVLQREPVFPFMKD